MGKGIKMTKSQIAAQMRAGRENAGAVNHPPEQAAAAPAPVLPARVFDMIPVSKIVKGMDNIRRFPGIDITPDIDPKLLELAESIRQQGVIEPIVVKERFDGAEYSLIAGFRRVSATKLAGLATIPACIYQGELTARQIMEIQITENIHRSDLAPTEEANIYKRMAEGMGCTREEIAARVGRSVKHVSRYLKMLALPDALRAKIDRGELSIAKAQILLSLTKVNMDRIIRDDGYMLKPVYTAHDFESYVKRKYMYELVDGISFDTNKKYVSNKRRADGWESVMLPACSACPYRDQLELFEEYVTDRSCPNAECFEGKEGAALEEDRERRDKEAEEKRRKRAAGEHVYETPEERKERERDERDKAEREEAKRVAYKDLEENEPLIAKKFEIGFNWPKDYLELRYDGVISSYNDHRDAVLDGLFKKYIGRGMADIKAGGSLEEIAKAEFITLAYDDNLYYSAKVALGLEQPRVTNDEDDEDEDEEGPDEAEEYGVDGDGEALDSEREEDE